jgi:hypothetical protein
MTTQKKTTRTKRGTFKKGVSGNPSGRPKSESTVLRAKLAEHGEAVAMVVLDAAKAGDLTACKLILERLLPPLKSTAPTVRVAVPSDGGLADTGRAILRAVTDGELAPDTGAQLVTALGGMARVTEIDELEKRVGELEKRNG